MSRLLLAPIVMQICAVLTCELPWDSYTVWWHTCCEDWGVGGCSLWTNTHTASTCLSPTSELGRDYCYFVSVVYFYFLKFYSPCGTIGSFVILIFIFLHIKCTSSGKRPRIQDTQDILCSLYIIETSKPSAISYGTSGSYSLEAVSNWGIFYFYFLQEGNMDRPFPKSVLWTEADARHMSEKYPQTDDWQLVAVHMANPKGMRSRLQPCTTTRRWPCSGKQDSFL